MYTIQTFNFIIFFICSAYQKILSWEPLLELVSIGFVGEAERKSSSLTVGDTLAMKVAINYNGPKVSWYIDGRREESFSFV